MSNYASGAKLADLTLAGDPAPAVAPAPAAPPTATAPPPPPAPARQIGTRSNDEYLAQAIQEFDAGEIDQPLWARALDLSGNNAEAAKPAYLRARAAALWVAKRNNQAAKPARRARKSSKDPAPPVASSRKPRRSKRATLVAGAVAASAVVLVVGFLVLSPSREPQKAVAHDTKPAQAVPRAAPKIAPAKAGEAERVSASGDDFSKKVSELKAAGNWNVLVLYAVEWVRKAPANAEAWNELGLGYAKLRQYNDALEATTKSTQLEPKNVQAWQSLGEINVALQQPAAALAAYEQAVALNGRDVTSLLQVGLMNAQLGHLPEARIAFAKVLELNPLDVDALCGAASVAQKEGRSKDADAITRQLKAADLRCREPAVAAPVVAAAVPGPAAKKVAPPSAPATKKLPPATR